MELSSQSRPSNAPGALVLALHGSASSAKQWRSLAAHLGGSAKVIAPDLPGYGLSAGETGSRLEALSDLAVGLGRAVHLVAHSFGGAIALRLAHEMPDHIASVTLYDPVVPASKDGGQTVFPAELQDLWNYGRDATPEHLMKAFMEFWAGHNSWETLRPKQRARLTEMAPGLRRDFTEAERGLWSLQQPSYRGPVAVLCGGTSPEVTLDMAELVTRNLPQTRLTWLAGHGHLAPLTEPDAIARYIGQCLKTHGVTVPPHTETLSKCAA